MTNERDPVRIRRVLGNKVQFIQGDMAVAYGGLLAGCSFFGGYPITPASEVAEGMARLLPRVKGTFIQMEDEIAGIASTIGAAWGGAKSMTATSGPGFSLMMENYGYAIMTETPCVIANVQRTGPSTGQPTLGAQGDMMQVRWGSHGDMEAIALCPSTVQECLDMTIECFNLAEKYRHPVCLMTDGEIGHLREKVVIPDEDEMELFERVLATIDKDKFIPFSESQTRDSKVPDFPTFGSGYHTYVTGLTHNDKGFPATDKQPDHERLILRLISKITDDREKLTSVEEIELDDAEVAFVSFGASARPCESAVWEARKKGMKVGMLRLKTVWPFPRDVVTQLSKKVKKIIVVEMNLGQIYHVVKEFAVKDCEVILAPKVGGDMHLPHELMEYLEVSN
ncbi:MAG: 2-oxoacid:acceptor oxidoreductase subunit alpha [Candidatus Thermoplasmatota archaeon]|nr:2-oxoacid:acceptor oxidoreductase subunit alpha [Euryarchaeota archaeon]MBU4071420.1 2-oxoacid:acceptor oxidoreductase subunit alpha [Candidatus Thermoplasmatota archaeon]MBU4591490.1 2-oxoacid:acceptor oxidoreductase subunit alpha [Candidatus Thermoplasmatota archaeon]